MRYTVLNPNVTCDFQGQNTMVSLSSKIFIDSLLLKTSILLLFTEGFSCQWLQLHRNSRSKVLYGKAVLKNSA